MYNDSLTSIGTLASTLPSLNAFDSLLPIISGSTTNTDNNKDCEYLKLVSGFKRTLVIPDAFFLNVMPLCYCASCLALSTTTNGGAATNSSGGGTTPSTNAILKGWVRFTINQFVTNVNHSGNGGGTSSATSLSSTDSCNDWTTAFYLTRVDKIRAILDHGQPLPIGKNNGNLSF